MGNSKLINVLNIVLVFIPLVGAAAVACVLEALSYILIRPLSLAKHRQICVFFTRSCFLCSSFLLQYWAGITFRSYGDRIDPTLSHLTVINHRSNVDWLIGLAYVAHLGSPYPGNAKSVVKASLGKVPIFGGILRFAEFLFLTRDWAKDRTQFLDALTSLRSFSKSAVPLWFVLYPEGTRFTEEKRAHSHAYAQEKNLQPHENVLFPRFKAFTAIVSTLRNEFDCVCDATFIFEPESPTMAAVFSRAACTVVHVHTKFYPMNEIPQGEEQLETWLLDRWYEKDQRISEFKKDPSALGPPTEHFFPIQGRPSVHPFYALVVLFVLSSILTVYRSSKTHNGLYVLFGSSLAATVMTAVFVAFNLKPSRKGSARSGPRR